MIDLQTMLLTGNKLTGTLGDVSANSSLRRVDLSSNQLTGTLPRSFQYFGSFSKLDLSHNKISGVLLKGFSIANDTEHLGVSMNRLSGRLPKSLLQLPSVDILKGNMVACRDVDGLPLHDPHRETYTCGSDDLDTVLELWAVIFGVNLLMFVFFLYVSRVASSVHPSASPAISSWGKIVIRVSMMLRNLAK